MSSQHASEGIARDRPAPVVEAALALIIERPSHGYHVWKRYEERFGDYYPIVKGRIYQAIDQLLDSELVEIVDQDSASPRQPKTKYKATAQGAVRYREWLAAGIRDDPRRDELLRRLLATGARDARGMLKIVDLYERAHLDDLSVAPPIPERGDEPDDRVAALRDMLIDEERRLTQEAQLRFVTFARRALRQAIDEESRR